MPPPNNFYLLIEETTIYDLNWLYCRRKIIAFNQVLNFWIEVIYKAGLLNLKIIWFKYCIYFNERVNHGRE